MKKLYILFILISVSTFAQDDAQLPELVPPSPTAFSFATYGNIPLNGSTGAFNFSVPLFNLKEGDISVQTSLNYYSNGVKIDQLSSEVGVDWMLNAGGVISRVVRDNPDETVNYRWYPESISRSEDYNNIKAAANDEGRDFDTEPDWFSFNVNGFSGEFYMDEDLNIHINSNEFLKITKTSDFNIFEITDPNGFRYIFGGDIGAVETNFSSNTCDRTSRVIYKTSWFLTEIISPKDNSMKFTYMNNSYEYATSISNTLNLEEDCYCSPSNETYSSNHSKCVSYSRINTKLLTKIEASNSNIEFQYSSGRPDVIGQGGAILNKIILNSGQNQIESFELLHETTQANNHKDLRLSGDNSLKSRFYLSGLLNFNKIHQEPKKHLFEYYSKEELPCRLSYNKDIFGYYNGSNNYNPFPNPKDPEAYEVAVRYAGSIIGANQDVNPSTINYGVLKKITYPTLGNTSIVYEANSDVGFVESDQTQSQSIYLNKGCNDVVNKEGEFTFISNGSPINYSANASIDTYICNSERDQLHDKYYVSIRDLTTGETIRSFSNEEGNYIKTDSFLNCSTNIYDRSKPVCTISGHEYKVRFSISSKFSQISGRMDVTYNKSTQLVEETVFGGGVRVNRVLDNSGTQISNEKEFYYNDFANHLSNDTSLNRIYDPKYSDFFSYWKNCIPECCGNLVGTTLEYADCANETQSLNNANKKRYVISSGSLNSLFSNRKQNVYYTAITTRLIGGNEDNGFVEKFYHAVGDNLAAVLYEPQILGTPSSNNSDMYYGQLDSTIIYGKTNNQYIKLSSEIYNYETLALDFKKAHVFKKNFDYQFVGVSDQNVDNISISLYQNYIYKRKLKSSKKSSFYPEILEEKTIYGFGSSPYYSIIQKSVSTSIINTSYLSKYIFPQYLINPDLVEELLVSKNQISNPIRTENLKVVNEIEIPISNSEIKYSIFGNDIVLPQKVRTSKGNSTLEDRLIYHRYNSQGNPLEVSKVNGPHIVYFWGYSKQQPIAKIENATYLEVADALGITPAQLDTYTEANLFEINNLRSVLSKAMITTYTYEPLVGLKSVTDSKGYSTTYDYDDFNRLKYIKDQDENILKEFEYHHKNN